MNIQVPDNNQPITENCPRTTGRNHISWPATQRDLCLGEKDSLPRVTSSWSSWAVSPGSWRRGWPSSPGDRWWPSSAATTATAEPRRYCSRSICPPMTLYFCKIGFSDTYNFFVFCLLWYVCLCVFKRIFEASTYVKLPTGSLDLDWRTSTSTSEKYISMRLLLDWVLRGLYPLRPLLSLKRGST